MLQKIASVFMLGFPHKGKARESTRQHSLDLSSWVVGQVGYFDKFGQNQVLPCTVLSLKAVANDLIQIASISGQQSPVWHSSFQSVLSLPYLMVSGFRIKTLKVRVTLRNK